MTNSSAIEKLNSALKELYTPADPQTLRKRTARMVRDLIPADVVRYAELREDQSGFENEYYTDRRDDFERYRPCFNAHMEEHPVLKYYRTHRVSRVLRISDLMPTERFSKTVIYNEFYRRMGIKHQLTTALFSREGRCREIILDREKRDFTAHNVRILEMLTPHLDQAFENAARIGILRSENVRLKNSLEATGEGFLLTDSRGKILYRSPKADQILEGTGEHDTLAPGRLSPRLKAFLDRMVFRLANPLSDAKAAPRLVLNFSTESRVIVRFSALPRLPGDRNEYLLILKRSPARNSFQPLRSLGLTPRQAQILQLIARGQSDADIGAALGISPRTVEKHLEHIYDKLGVENRVDASRRAFEVTYANSA